MISQTRSINKKRFPKSLLIISFFIVLNNSLVIAKENKPKLCSSETHRAFDFWLGEWQVLSAKQKTPPSRSSITLSNDGCSIHERYVTASGFTGNSINFYDKQSKRWHQTWIDNQGGALYLNGGIENGVMILSDGVNRISWTLLSDRRVNQVWETTKDNGKTWQKIFDGFYSKIN